MDCVGDSNSLPPKMKDVMDKCGSHTMLSVSLE